MTVKRAKAAKKPAAKKTEKKTRPAGASVAAVMRVGRDVLAKLMGVNADTISHWTKNDGLPVLIKGGHGKESAYDAVVCLEWQRQRAGKNARENAQTKLYEVNARIGEQKYQREQGLLVEREQVVLEGQAYTKAWTGKVRGLARRLVLAGVIPSADAPKAHAVFLELLTDISQWSSIADTKKAANDGEA